MTTTTTAGYIARGDLLVLTDGSQLEVASWDLTDSGEVAVFASWGERWLFGATEVVTISGDVSHRF